MKGFLEYLVKSIVDKPDVVVVNQTLAETGITNLELTVDPTDMGKVIGKSGRIIKAVRDLVRILAVKQNQRVNVILSEA